MPQAIPIKTRRVSRRTIRLRRRLAIAAVALFALQNAGVPPSAASSDPSLVVADAVAAASASAAPEMTVALVEPTTVAPVAAPARTVAEPPVPSVAFVPSAPPATTAASVPVPIRPALHWQGTAGQEGYVRSGPARSATRVGELRPGQPVQVLRWVAGEEVEKENTTWADLGDGRFVYSALLRSRGVVATPPAPANAPSSGRWIDVNLTLQIATAYEGGRPVKSVLVSTGRPGWETHTGTFAVQRRVAKETMDGQTLRGQGPNGEGASYKVENVRWTQYFAPDGSAIHENYWRNPALFGMPGSHGCIGMRPDDAAWFWEFAAVGTPIVIH